MVYRHERSVLALQKVDKLEHVKNMYELQYSAFCRVFLFSMRGTPGDKRHANCITCSVGEMIVCQKTSEYDAQ